MPARLMNSPILILGPQRPAPNLARALADVGVQGPVALITAGWRYDEAETVALGDHLPYELVHLPLYRWFDELMEAAPELRASWRARQERILAFKVLHRLRLAAAYRAVLRLGRTPVQDPYLHEAELLDAVAMVRQLDLRAVEMSQQIKSSSGLASTPWTHPAAAAQVSFIEETLERCDTLCVAGGHVAVLLNRLEAFGFARHLAAFQRRGGRIVGWSAGAMVLSPRVVLFYDDPPEGTSEPEVLDAGFDLIGPLTVFPHPRQRLRLGDADRMKLLQARFGLCRGLENGAWLQLDERGEWLDRSLPGTAPRLGDVPAASGVGAALVPSHPTELFSREETVDGIG